MQYQAPDVYIEDVKSGSQSVAQASASVAAMIGVTRSGVLNTPVLVTSWTDFITKFANGLDTPFTALSYFPYAVYGFFTNGGKQLYVSRIAHSTAKKATKAGTNVTVTAKTEGSWGNDLTVKITKSADYVETTNEEFDVSVTLGSSDSVKISGVFKDTIVDAILDDSKAGNWISSVEVTGEALEEETITLAEGADGASDLVDADYVNALENLNTIIEDVTMVAIPGITTKTVQDGLLAYCDNNKVFPIVTAPVGSTIEEAKALRKSMSATYGAMPYPWGVVTDPLTNKPKIVPPEGHYAGVCARIINNRGVHKAPAGTEATLRGFIAMEKTLSKADCEVLNPVGVICLLTRRNYGLVVWGARGLNSADTTMRYVSDHFLNIHIRKSLYEGTQFAVFEPNDATLWASLRITCKQFMEGLFKQGAFKGAGEGDAYYIICDGTNNTDATIAEGIVNIEIGYAPVKPSEFVVIKLAHSISSAE